MWKMEKVQTTHEIPENKMEEVSVHCNLFGTICCVYVLIFFTIYLAKTISVFFFVAMHLHRVISLMVNKCRVV
jgi:hypothetical protein